MPMSPTPDGFVITYSRGKCAVLGSVMMLFAVGMIAVGLDIYFSIFEGTPFDGISVERQPQWLWGAIMIAGGALLFLIAGWNAGNALRSGSAIKVSQQGIEARTLIGKRTINWSDIGLVAIVRNTILIHPAAGTHAKAVPLQMFLTSIKADEMLAAMAKYRPDKFLEAEA